MKNAKRWLSAFAALTMTASLVACAAPTSTPPSTVSSPQSVSTGASDGGIKKPEKITLMVDGSFIMPEAGQADLVAKYKELTGIDLEIIQPAHNEYYEKVNLLFATDEKPDVLILSADYSQKFARNGLLVDLLPLLDKAETLSKTIDRDMINELLVDGRLNTMPGGESDGSVTFVRQDWLDKLKIDVPTTFEEYMDMLRAFKTLGGSTIPYIAPGIVSDEMPYTMYTPDFFQGANPDFVNVDGKWVDGMLQPNMKQALERWQAAFKEGLVDMEIITNKTSTCRDKLTSGNAGAFTYWSGWIEELQKNLTATDANAKLTAIPPIDGISYVGRTPPGLAITTDCENPEGVFKYFFEVFYDGGEGQMLFTNGVQGVHYKGSGDSFEVLPAKDNPTQPVGQTMLGRGANINGFDDPFKESEVNLKANQLFKENRMIITPSAYAKAKDQHGADILLMRKEALADIIYGNISIDDGLEKYKKASEKLVNTVLDELNTPK